MMEKKLTVNDGVNAVYGGCILGGGGGGIIKEGLEKSEKSFKYGEPSLISIDSLNPEDIVVCVSLVGAPSAKNQFLSDNQLINTIKKMQKELDEPIKAIMTNENGAATTVNGWLQSSALDLPFLDAPSNGRAHPTGSMGAMNLSEKKDYQSIQSFAGGKNEAEVSGIVSGSLANASDTIRDLSVRAGGLVAVCRNPVNISHVSENAAIGGITQAIKLGEVLFENSEGIERINRIVNYLNGNLISKGRVSNFSLKNKDGFDVGTLRVDNVELTFWNEYMTIEKDGKRISTFPDLIMTFDLESGLPIVSADITENKKIVVISVQKTQLLLGSTMYNQNLLKTIEPIINKKICEV